MAARAVAKARAKAGAKSDGHGAAGGIAGALSAAFGSSNCGTGTAGGKKGFQAGNNCGARAHAKGQAKKHAAAGNHLKAQVVEHRLATGKVGVKARATAAARLKAERAAKLGAAKQGPSTPTSTEKAGGAMPKPAPAPKPKAAAPKPAPAPAPAPKPAAPAPKPSREERVKAAVAKNGERIRDHVLAGRMDKAQVAMGRQHKLLGVAGAPAPTPAPAHAPAAPIAPKPAAPHPDAHAAVEQARATVAATTPAPAAHDRGAVRSRIEAAFEKHDHGNNFVKIHKLRAELPDVPREHFDAALRDMRRDRHYSGDTHEGLYGTLTKDERDAGIREAGTNLVYLSRTNDHPGPAPKAAAAPHPDVAAAVAKARTKIKSR